MGRGTAGIRLAVAAALAAAAAGCAQQSAAPAPPASAAQACAPFTQRGVASWYGPSHHGKRTASGAPFDMNGLTAAHRTLPLGTRIEVENLGNGRKVTVTVNDRGPYVRGRVLDLSRAAAQRLDFKDDGTAPVRITAPANCREAKRETLTAPPVAERM